MGGGLIVESKWQEMYRSKLMTADDAAKHISNGMLMASGSINAQPQALCNAVGERMASGDLRDVRSVFIVSPTGVGA